MKITFNFDKIERYTGRHFDTPAEIIEHLQRLTGQFDDRLYEIDPEISDIIIEIIHIIDQIKEVEK